MTYAQISFFVSWLLLSIIAIMVTFKSKKYDGKQRFLLSIMLLIVPIVAAVIYLLMKYRSHASFWSNSATKDKTWIAESDINKGSSGDDSRGDDSSCSGGD